MVVSLDANKYLVSTDAHWYVNGAEVICTRHKLSDRMVSGPFPPHPLPAFHVQPC